MMAKPRSFFSAATKKFTDRVEPRRAFRSEYQRAKASPDEYFLLAYYGIGGIGKTSLLNQIIRENFKNDDSRDNIGRYYIKYDFETSVDLCTILTSWRNMLVHLDRNRFSFLRFDLAYLKYLESNGEHNSTLDQQRKSCVDSNPILKIAMEVSGFVPVVSDATKIVKAVLNSKDAVVDQVEKQKTRQLAQELRGMLENEIYKNLPRYFIEDLNECTDRLDEPLVIFLDTYEKFANYLSAESGDHDSWLVNPHRGILCHSRNVLWVLAGREKPRLDWYALGFDSIGSRSLNEVPNPDDYIESKLHLLGQLSELDACTYLRDAGVDQSYIPDIYRLTLGNPLWLDIAVDEYHLCLQNGHSYQAAQLVSARELLNRYIKYLDHDMQDLVRKLAVLGRWWKELLQILDPFNHTVYRKLSGACFMIHDGEECYMHHLVRSVIAETCRQEGSAELLSICQKAQTYCFQQMDTLGGKDSRYSRCLMQLIDMALYFPEVDFDWDRILQSIHQAHLGGSYSAAWTAISRLYENADQVYCPGIRFRVRFEYLEQLSTLQGDYNRCREGMEALLQDCTETLGRDAPITLSCLNTLATLTARTGHPEDALRLAREAYDRRRAVLGEDHQDTLVSLSNLSIRYGAVGENGKSLEIARTVYEKRRKIWGDAHRLTIRSLNNLGVRLGAMGQHAEALQIASDVYEKRKNLLGENHLDTQSAFYNLAYALSMCSRHEEAAEAAQKLYRIRAEILGEEHPFTLRAAYLLAEEWAQLGRTDDAAALLSETAERYRSVLGSEHPDTKKAVAALQELSAGGAKV